MSFSNTPLRSQRGFFKKEKDARSAAQKRRDLFLLAQKERARDLQRHARELVQTNSSTNRSVQFPSSASDESSAEVMEEEKQIDQNRKKSKDGDKMEDEGLSYEQRREIAFKRARKKRLEYALQLLTPDWMTDVPQDLKENWFVCPRPEGRRCLVTTLSGTTVSRGRNGTILHRFNSAFPGGSQATHDNDAYCILDCIYQEKLKTYFVLDLMCWKSMLLYDSDLECRLFNLHSRLSEIPIDKVSHGNKFRFASVSMAPCTTENIKIAYEGDHGYQRDGLLFYNKEAPYVMGISPLHLVWKDRHCSPYFIDTPDGKTFSKRQVVSLTVHDDYSVRTMEDYNLGILPEEFCKKNDLKAGTIVKLTIAKIDETKAVPAVEGLHFHKKGGRSRILPEMWSKILFQNNARFSCGVSIDHILNSISGEQPQEILVDG